MKLFDQKAECIDNVNADDIYKKIELCGRVCYQSEPKEDSAENFVRMLIKRGHESVLEHVSLTFHIVTDRGILDELTRHRLASYSVESTRYCNYKDVAFLQSYFFDEVTVGKFIDVCKDAEKNYKKLSAKFPPEVARLALPLCTKTELYMTANLREWRHIIKLRTDKAAHPQMSSLVLMIYFFFKKHLPVIVEDIKPTVLERN